MTETAKQTAPGDLARIIESARRLGVEVDEAEALQWLAAVASTNMGGDVVVDTQSGVFGHKVTMLDFSSTDLARFREVGRLVEFKEEPGVETALALSGSAAQSKIQTHPGDADYFERVNIKAPTRAEASGVLGRIMRQKALQTLKGPTYRLIEVKFGQYPFDLVKGGRTLKAGSPIAWGPTEIEAGRIEGTRPDGTAAAVTWDEVAVEPGWCKLDWVVVDPVRRQVANASNMLDVTWEAPDGKITPLDGYLDPYFQEVYLEAESIPIFSRLARQMSSSALEDYIGQLEKEVRKYVGQDPNYGKAAKRMYNIFRLTGRYEEAVYIRELFDEPATVLYQVWSLIRTIEDATGPDSSISSEDLIAQADELTLSVVRVLEGEQEVEIVRQLLRLRDGLVRRQYDASWLGVVEAARAEIINVVNNFFFERLTTVPTIKGYIEGFQGV